jgi:hypothetical protein
LVEDGHSKPVVKDSAVANTANETFAGWHRLALTFSLKNSFSPTSMMIGTIKFLNSHPATSLSNDAFVPLLVTS